MFPSKYDSGSPFDKGGGQDWIFYHLSAYGKDFHFNLTLNRELVSPSFLVEYRNNSGVMSSHRYVKDCHYQGVVKGNGDSSRVAISNCYGLVSTHILIFDMIPAGCILSPITCAACLFACVLKDADQSGYRVLQHEYTCIPRYAAVPWCCVY